MNYPHLRSAAQRRPGSALPTAQPSCCFPPATIRSFGERVTPAAEATQIRATTLLGQPQPVVHHLGGEGAGPQLSAHAILVRPADHHAALRAGRRWPSSLNGSQARVQRVGVAHPGSAGFGHHRHHHQQTNAYSCETPLRSCHCHCHCHCRCRSRCVYWGAQLGSEILLLLDSAHHHVAAC